MARSYYLDDMNRKEGDKVLCKAAIGSLGLTAGRIYTVEMRDVGCTSNVAGIVNDDGNWCIPSARFQNVT